jgi:hypothetical protein
MPDTRKRKKKHLKLATIGGHTTVQLGGQWITITIQIPRKRLTQRLAGSDLRYLKRFGNDLVRNKTLNSNQGRLVGPEPKHDPTGPDC